MPRKSAHPGNPPLSSLAAELRVVVGQLRRRLRDQAPPGDLSWSQVAVLGHLEREGPATVTRLAQLEGVRQQSMGATVAALQAAGLLSGSPHPTDGRQTLWSPTTACHDLIKANRAAREDWLLRALQTQLSADEQKELARAVESLKRIAES
jgi:DNA-binding MarR family transcriptional regulator